MPIGQMMMARNSTTNNFTQMECDNSAHLKVVDSTTATSLGGKLDSIITNTANIKASIEVGGDLYVSQDEVEAKLETLHTDLVHLSDNNDHHNSKFDVLHQDILLSNTALGNIDGELEGITPLLTTANLNTAHISDNLDHLSANLDTINATLTGGSIVDTSLISTHAKQDDLLTAQALTTATINSRMAIVATANDNIKTAVDSLGTNLLLPIAPMSVASIAILAKNTEIETSLDSLILANHVDIVNTKDMVSSVGTTTNNNLTHLSDNLDHLSANMDTLESSNQLILAKETITATQTTGINDTIADLLSSSQIVSEGFTSCDTDTLEATLELILTKNTGIESAVDENKAQVNALIIANHNDIVNMKDRIDFLITQQSADLHLQHDKTDHLSANLDTLEASLASMEGKQDTQITHLSEIEGAIETIEGTVGLNKVNVNISSGGFGGAITNAHLAELGTAINSAKVDVNISSGNITGFATQTTLSSILDKNTEINLAIDENKAKLILNTTAIDQNKEKVILNTTAIDLNKAQVVLMSAKLPASLGQKANASSMSVCRTSTAGAYDLSARTTIATASTTTKLLCDAQGHIQADIISSALPSGGATSSLQGDHNTKLDSLITLSTLNTACEDKEVIDDDAISGQSLSVAIDCEFFRNVRMYGNTTTASGSNLTLWGSNLTGGTYYQLNNADFQATTISISGTDTHYIGINITNPPRFVKVFNKATSTTFTITKLRMVGYDKHAEQ